MSLKQFPNVCNECDQPAICARMAMFAHITAAKYFCKNHLNIAADDYADEWWSHSIMTPTRKTRNMVRTILWKKGLI